MWGQNKLSGGQTNWLPLSVTPRSLLDQFHLRKEQASYSLNVSLNATRIATPRSLKKMRLHLLSSLAIFGPLIARAKDYQDYDFSHSHDYDDGDIFLPPPQKNRVVGFFEGPLPASVELNLNLKYDPTLLKQFHGSKDNAEAFIKRVVELARPHLQQHQLKVKVHIKVTN